MTVIVKKNVFSMLERLKQIRQNGMILFDSLFFTNRNSSHRKISPSERDLSEGFSTSWSL